MIPVVIPTLDVNSERVALSLLTVQSESHVEEGEVLAELETSKSLFELVAPASGWIRWSHSEGDSALPGDTAALIFDSLEALKAYREPDKAQTTASDVRATVAAQKRAAALGVDLAQLKLDRLITSKDVEAAAATEQGELPEALQVNDGRQRVVVLGAGRGANQVIDIFAGSESQVAVAVLDDNNEHWGRTIAGVPVVGGCERLEALLASKTIDRAIIAVSKTTKARRVLRQKCVDAKVALTNAIDSTSKIATEVTLGEGNVICAFCHVGTCTELGDNNFISAYNSIEHHNVWGDNISTGPGCMTSSRVKLGDGVRLGTGIFIQPGVELGDEVAVASGSVLVDSVPARHVVKTKIVTTIVVPPKD